MKWLLSLSLVLVTSITSSASAQQLRGLQENTICSRLASANFGPGDVSCDCKFLPVRGEVSLKCTRKKVLCTPGNMICGNASMEGLFSLIKGASLSTKICYGNVTYEGWSFPTTSGEDICFSYEFINALKLICPDGLLACLLGSTAEEDEVAATSLYSSAITDTRVTVGDQACQSSAPCNEDTGMSFDCGNVMKGLVVEDECLTVL